MSILNPQCSILNAINYFIKFLDIRLCGHAAMLPQSKLKIILFAATRSHAATTLNLRNRQFLAILGVARLAADECKNLMLPLCDLKSFQNLRPNNLLQFFLEPQTRNHHIFLRELFPHSEISKLGDIHKSRNRNLVKILPLTVCCNRVCNGGRMPLTHKPKTTTHVELETRWFNNICGDSAYLCCQCGASLVMRLAKVIGFRREQLRYLATSP